MAIRTLIRPTAFVDAPFGHDGKVARLSGGLNWFAMAELIGIDGHRRVQVRGAGDEHGIELLLGQHLLMIFVNRQARLEPLQRLEQPGGGVGCGRQLGDLKSVGDGGMQQAHLAKADHANA